MRDHILHDSVYIKCPEKPYLYKQKVDCWLLKSGNGKGDQLTLRGQEKGYWR